MFQRAGPANWWRDSQEPPGEFAIPRRWRRKRLCPSGWAPPRNAELILFQYRVWRRSRSEPVSCVEVVIAKKLPRRPMEAVGSRFADGYESPSRRVSELRTVAIRQERELANRVRIGKVCRTIIEPGYKDSAVKRDFTAVNAASIHVERRAAALIDHHCGTAGLHLTTRRSQLPARG